MIFNIYSKDGSKGYRMAWFDNIEQAIESMLKNPQDAYHRKMK